MANLFIFLAYSIMYYRIKIILALLQAFEGKLEKITLQKLLFMFTRMQEKQSFHFVPYKLGCFSFQANADLFTMIKFSNFKSKDDLIWFIYLKHPYFAINSNLAPKLLTKK